MNLETLLKKSNRVSFSAERIKGFFRLQESSDVLLIKGLENGEVPNISFQTEALKYNVGDEISYNISLLHTGYQYASYQNYIQHSLNTTTNPSISGGNFLIYEDFYNQQIDKNFKSLIAPLNSIIFFIQCLANKYYCRDNQIIIFARTHCEIPIQPNNFNRYIELSKYYLQSELLLESIQKFTNWLVATSEVQDESLAKSLAVHENERYAIAASEFVDNLSSCDKNERIFSLLGNIDNIYQSTLSKYSLYLDDFKYSKFNDKIAKYADEFLVKVNKVISDLQTQILAIPLAIAVLATFKPDTKLNQSIFFAFFLYSIMVFYATAQQTYNLKHIESQVKNFINDNNLPSTLNAKWFSEIEPVNQKIFWHKIYLIGVFLFISIVMWICAFYLAKHLF